MLPCPPRQRAPVPPPRARRPIPAAFLAACALLLPATGIAADWQLQVHSDRHSDFSSIDDLRDENAAKFEARGERNLAYLLEEVRLQRTDGPWGLALLARSSATLVANRDAIDAFRHRRGAGRDATDRQWNVDARLRGFAGAGVELQRGVAIAPEWKGAVLVQALALTRWRQQEVTGPADYAGAGGTYTFDLRSTERNSHRDFPFQQSRGPVGAGLLFGGDLTWTGGPWSLHAAVRDVGWLRWRGLPRQDLTLTSSTREIDPEGFVVIGSALRGQNSQSTFTRSAPYRITLDGSWDATTHGTAHVGARYFRGFSPLPFVGWKQRWADATVGATWQVHERRLLLDAQWGGWQAFVGLDRFSGARSRVLGVRYARSM